MLHMRSNNNHRTSFRKQRQTCGTNHNYTVFLQFP
jgi:hypothetical protein